MGPMPMMDDDLDDLDVTAISDDEAAAESNFRQTETWGGHRRRKRERERKRERDGLVIRDRSIVVHF